MVATLPSPLPIQVQAAAICPPLQVLPTMVRAFSALAFMEFVVREGKLVFTAGVTVTIMVREYMGKRWLPLDVLSAGVLSV